MQSIIVSLFLVYAAASASTFKGFNGLSRSLFGVARGGGLFGGDKKEATADLAAATQKYPPMSNDEVEEWLSHIPVFAVTDTNGAGVVLKPDNDTNVFYFFMSPLMANATLNQLKGTTDLDLRISAFSLGKIWFNILKSSRDVKLKAPGSDDEIELTSSNVQYRLVPDTRDLLGARMLLTMDGSEGEALKKGETLTPEMAQNAVKKAMTSSPKFNATYNEIPVFMIQQMRIQKQPEGGDAAGAGAGEATTLIPMYFSLQNMVQIWQQFTSQSEETKGVEPAINLMDLFELVEKMQEESEIDFRNVLLVPSQGGPGAGGGAAAAAGGVAAPQAGDGLQMPGAGTTLGDV
eukprot:CAMPEP_0172491674 /NCGR_PEP_ID=MMETSP1066-20121228/22543_1 /TAXON_ID=671091 /ORGANISM="Coscinodiscus wailesii, Strain CCMP2513" /LENGTH=347 /DNA_ID=CAMNT_0013260835 /DNA_START=84 /DNA_END=1127 /DNA_ORIENTATION=-